MHNPFRTRLQLGNPAPATVGADPDIGQAAAVLDTDNYNPGDNDQTPNGVTSEHAGGYRLGTVNLRGIAPTTNNNLVTGGAVDMETPWDIGGAPSAQHEYISVSGPVDGHDSVYTNLQDPLPSFNPNYAGPVVGGADYATSLAQAELATQAAQLSQAAIASALVSAV